MNSRRRTVRIAIGLACACLAVVLLIAIYKLMRSAPSRTNEQLLSIAQVVTGALGAAAGLTALALLIRQARPPTRRRQHLLAPKLMEQDLLVDRAAEMGQLIERIGACQVVNCTGPRGAGKSFLLEHLADVVNGHRSPSYHHPKPRGISSALYFDLADAVGFNQIVSQICQAALGDRHGSWADFVAYAKQGFGRRRVVLILDNVNSQGLWQALGEAAHQYLASRAADKVIFGSIDPVRLSNFRVENVSVGGLDLEATKQLVATTGADLTRNELNELHRECSGLPFYVRVLTVHGWETRTDGGRAIVDERIIPSDLPSETRRLLAYVSLLALMKRQISMSELERCPIAQLEDQVAIAENRTLLTPVPSEDQKMIKVHDIARDTALRLLGREVSEAALELFERSYQEGDTERSAIYAMFADPDQIGTARFDELFGRVIPAAVKARKYALLSTLHDRARESTRILRFIAADRARADLFCYGRASELAGLGHYAKAEEALLSSSIVRTRWDRDRDVSSLQPEMRFLQADIAHLQNRYDEAALMFDELGEWAALSGYPPLRARCVWGHAHVLRHQGRDLDRALLLFGQAAMLGDAANDLFAKAYSVTGATGIKVLTDTVPSDEERVLADIEEEIAATSSHDGYMLEVWKSQAQVAWVRERRQSAADIIEAAIARALALNDRLLYNLYFERAEFCRLTGAVQPALEAYGRVLRFGTVNGDRNLISNAMLGMVLVDLFAGRWLNHSSDITARSAALDARRIAQDADIQITAHMAGKVVAMLDNGATTSPDPIRLILL